MGSEMAWVEGDSEAAIQAFSNDAIPWVLDARWKIVKKKDSKNYIFSYTEEANFGADCMSKKACFLLEGERATYVGRPHFLKVEISMREYFRFD
ncbi:hypothetical protein GIB67_018029 [Kingdonia uniflora]|uniref:Uncharacterized protein n=1 Tax=Kingdonia uniflora TaxID=39325 RepID=A0A7J7NWC3_9MAGN|nr:hypothetical protein GIB67_018029 [Kingdonia uniflora]